MSKDKRHPHSKTVVIGKLKDDYGSTVALKVVLHRLRRTDDGVVWEPKRSHVFSAAFSRRACREQARRLADRWAAEYGAKVVMRD